MATPLYERTRCALSAPLHAVALNRNILHETRQLICARKVDVAAVSGQQSACQHQGLTSNTQITLHF
jgi:hypothetical protein